MGGDHTLHPDELTIETVPERLAAHGDPWEEMNGRPQSLEPLLELNERDRAAGLMDAPWPPVYPKQPDEPPRVAPSRARKDARLTVRPQQESLASDIIGLCASSASPRSWDARSF